MPRIALAVTLLAIPLFAQSRELAELGAADYELREVTTQKLLSVGREWPHLDEGLRSPDAEVRLRCRAIHFKNPWDLDGRLIAREAAALAHLRQFQLIQGGEEENAASVAVSTISRWGSLARPVLYDILESQATLQLKRAAARKLAACAIPEDSTRLFALLQSAERDVAGHVLWTLANVRDELTPDLESLMVPFRDAGPTWIRLRYWLVRGRLGASGAYDQAVKVLEEFMTATEGADVHWGYANLAWVYDLSGDNEKGLEAVDQAIELRKDDVDLYLRKASFYSSQRKHAEALGILQQAEKIDPNDTYVQSRLGSCLHMLGKTAEGIEYALRAAENGYPLYWSANNLAWMLATADDPAVVDGATAVAWARYGLELKPDSPSILGTLGEALLADGQPEAAAEVLEQAIERMLSRRDYQGAATERCFLAMARARLGQREEAERLIGLVQKADPDNHYLARAVREIAGG